MLAATAFVAALGALASAIGLHAAGSAIARAQSYDTFHGYVRAHERRRVILAATSAAGVGFAGAAAVAWRTRRASGA